MKLPNVRSFESKNPPVAFAKNANPLERYFSGDAATRWGILVHHPQVEGFVYMNGSHVTVAYLPRIVLNFDREGKTQQAIGAVTGDLDDFTIFTVQSDRLTSSALHFMEIEGIDKNIPISTSINSFVKPGSTIDNLPDFTTFEEVGIGALPLVFPKLRGFPILDGEINDDEVFDALATCHPLADDWAKCMVTRLKVPTEFLDAHTDLPGPDVDDSITILPRRSMAVTLLIRDTDPSSTYNSVKESVLAIREAADASSMPAPAPIPLASCRPPFSGPGNHHDEGESTDSSVKVNPRFAKYMAFTQILLNVASFDDNGHVLAIEPCKLSTKLEECVEDAKTSADLARNIGDSFEAYVEYARSGKSYMSKAVDLPFMTTTLLTYETQLNIHQGPLDSNLSQQKKSFTALSLLPPPTKDLDAYNEFVNASKDADVEDWLGQPSEKKMAKKKYVFVKGRQEKIIDVVSFLANIITFCKFRGSFSIDDEETHPTLVQICFTLAETLTSSDCREYFSKYESRYPYMAHTLVSAICNIFAQFVKAAKHPDNIRRLRSDNSVSKEIVATPVTMMRELIAQLQSAVLSNSLGSLFASKPLTYILFFPDSERKRNEVDMGSPSAVGAHNGDKRGDRNPTKRPKNEGKACGSIVNKTGKPLRLPRGFEQKYCQPFLDCAESCRFGKACNFKHASIPDGLTSGDLSKMKEFVESTAGLSFHPTVKFTEGSTSTVAEVPTEVSPGE